MYTEEVMDHFRNPRNVGTLKEPDGIGKVGNPVCGDVMEIHIKVERIRDRETSEKGIHQAVSTTPSSRSHCSVRSVASAIVVRGR